MSGKQGAAMTTTTCSACSATIFAPMSTVTVAGPAGEVVVADAPICASCTTAVLRALGAALEPAPVACAACRQPTHPDGLCKSHGLCNFCQHDNDGNLTRAGQ